MATPDFPEAGQAEHPAAPGPILPGHTVDELRAQCKAPEARAEFERLLQEGADSGIDPRVPTALFDVIRAEIRARTTTQSSGNAGAQG